MASSETTTTGRRARNPVSYTYPDSDDEEVEVEDTRPAEAANDSDSNENSDDESNNNAEPRRVRPAVHEYWHWHNKENLDEFQSVDDKLIRFRWGRRGLDWRAGSAIIDGERSLLNKQDQNCVELEPQFGKEVAARISQVPYRKFILRFVS